MLQPLHTFNESHSFSRRDIEEEISRHFGLEQFSFSIIESESGNFLTLDEDIIEDKKLSRFLGLDSSDLDDEALEDAAFYLIGHVTKIRELKRVILIDEDKNLLVLN